MINARFLKRLFAFLIDTLIVFILSTIIYSMLNGIFNFNTSETNKYTEEITEIVNEMDKLDSGMENEEDIEKSYELLDQITEKSKDNFKVILNDYDKFYKRKNLLEYKRSYSKGSSITRFV